MSGRRGPSHCTELRAHPKNTDYRGVDTLIREKPHGHDAWASPDTTLAAPKNKKGTAEAMP